VKVTEVEGITEYQLSNGLRVLLFPDPSKPTATINITYFVGSRHEAYGETGMAHLLEHLLFKGTPRHPNIPQELTEHGSRPNGTTWYDRTNYFETVPATEKNIDWALDLEADRMVNSFVSKKDLESEFSVVRNEFEMGENSPLRVLLQRTLSAAFLWHNYGKSTIGARSDIENVPIERLQAFYRKYYQPDNAILVVAGKFDPERTLRVIQDKFGRIPRPVRSLEKGNLLYPTYTAEPTQDGERSVTVRRVGDVQLAMAAYHIPAGSHEDFAAIDILAQILGDQPSGRLYKALVEPKLAAEAGSFAFQLREPGVLMAYAQVRQEGSLDSARAALVNTLDQAAKAPVTDEEVDRARTTLLKNIELLLNNSERVGYQLSEWASMGDWRLMFLHRDRLKKVTSADVQRVAAAYLKPANRTIGLFIPTSNPDRAVIPPVPDVAAMVKDYKGEATVAAGEAFDPSPENIERRTTRSTLPSGMRVTLLPKKTRGETVNARIALRFGAEPTLMNRSAAAELAGGMLDRGTTALTRQQVKDSLDKLKARVSISGGTTSATATIQTVRANLPAVLELVAQELRSPAFDAKELEQLRQELLAQLEEARSEPTVQASVAFTRRLSPFPKGHPFYTSSLDERVADLKAATLDEVKRFHADFYGAGAGDLAIVGDFDTDAVMKVATAAFGDWKGTQPFTRIAWPFHAVDSSTTTLETPDKANAFFVAGLNIALRDDDPDYPAMAIANFIMGGGFLNSRLATRIRQKEGLSYGVGSRLMARPLDRSGQWSAQAIYAPENVDRLVAAYREEVAKVLTEGFTAQELAAAKQGYLQQRVQSRANDNELVGTLLNYRYLDRTMSYDAELEKKVQALTVQQVNDAIKKYVDPSRITIVKAGDFAKQSTAGAQKQQ
jgi:zinc protease